MTSTIFLLWLTFFLAIQRGQLGYFKHFSSSICFVLRIYLRNLLRLSSPTLKIFGKPKLQESVMRYNKIFERYDCIITRIIIGMPNVVGLADEWGGSGNDRRGRKSRRGGDPTRSTSGTRYSYSIFCRRYPLP